MLVSGYIFNKSIYRGRDDGGILGMFYEFYFLGS